MTTAIWISLVVGAMVVASNLISGYLQRRQMRQNELFRLDASVGLIPPPHPLTLFLRKHRLVLLDTGIATYFLASGLLIPGPPTRLSVFNIAAGIGTVLLALMNSMFADLYRTLIKIIDVIAMQSDTQAKTNDFALATSSSLEKALGEITKLAVATEMLSNTKRRPQDG
jgi:hypothetical protein